MPDLNSLVSVLPSAAAAQAVCEQLDAAGIESAVVEAEGAFRLLVAESDFARAMQLLFPVPSAEQAAKVGAPEGARPWKCAHCGEEVQPISDICWACGKPRAGAPAAAPAAVSPPPNFPYPSAPSVELPPAPSSVPAAPPRSAKTAAPLEAVFSGRESEAGEPEAFASALSSMAAAPQNREADGARSPTAPAPAPLEATPQKRPSRPPLIEEPNPWRSPRLIAVWVLLGIAICFIAWQALR